MKKILVLTMVSFAVLNACGNIDKEKLGLSRKAPNENLVSVRPPLSLPPEYDYSPAKQAQKNMFKAPAASYNMPVAAVSEPKETKEEAPRKYKTNAMRKSSVANRTAGMSNAEQAFVSQVRANQQAYRKQEAEEVAKAAADTEAAKKIAATVENKTEAEPDISALAEEELKSRAAAENKVTEPVSAPAAESAGTVLTQQKQQVKTTAKPVVSKKYSAPQYNKKTVGKRSPLKPLPKRKTTASSDGMSAGEKALINHFDNQSYMSDTVN